MLHQMGVSSRFGPPSGTADHCTPKSDKQSGFRDRVVCPVSRPRLLFARQLWESPQTSPARQQLPTAPSALSHEARGTVGEQFVAPPVQGVQLLAPALLENPMMGTSGDAAECLRSISVGPQRGEVTWAPICHGIEASAELQESPAAGLGDLLRAAQALDGCQAAVAQLQLTSRAPDSITSPPLLGSGSLGDGRGDNATGPPPNAGEDDGTPNLMSTPIGASGFGNTQLLFQEGGNEQTPQSTSQVRRPQPWRLPPPLLMSEDRSQSPMAGSLSSGMHTPKQRTRLWGIGGDRPPPLPPRLKRQRSR